MLLALVCAVTSAELCTSRETLRSVTLENIDNFIGKDRPVFLRMIFAGCPWAPDSYKGWQAAAAMYPQITFLELDCLKDSKGLERCGEYQAAAQGKQTSDGVASPFHVLFNAGETTPIKDAWLSRGSEGGDPRVFVELITEYLQYGHVEFLKMLTPDSTDTFVKTDEGKYSAMVLFNSKCDEDSTFVGAWATAMSQDLAPVPPAEADVSYGRLDCGLFPEECQRWSSIVPSVVFHTKTSGGAYPSVTVTSITDLGVAVQSAKSQLSGMTTGTIPDPVPVTPSEPDYPKDDKEYTILKNDDLEGRTVDDVKELYQEYVHDFNGKAWTGTMEKLDQCVVGESNLEDRQQAVKNANIVRKLAGVDELSLNDDKYLSGCQRTALVLHKLGYITHYPNVDRGDICIAGEKSVVAEYAEKSNLAQNCASATKSIDLFMEDLGEENAQALGHRRWILNPNVKEIGFGVAPQRSYSRGQTTSGLQINDARPSIVVMRITTPDDQPYDKVKFISWPSAGPFPSEQVPPIWHVSCSLFRDTAIRKSDVKIRVTREDGQSIPVTGHFFNRQYMGTPDALLMQMDDNVKELCSAGHTVKVEIWVERTKQKLEYSFTLFDLQKEVKICLYNANADKCSAYEKKYGPGNYGNVATDMSSEKAARALVFVGEPINGPIDWTAAVGRILVSGESISGEVKIGKQTILEVGDAKNAEVVVSWDMPAKQAGQFYTAGKPKKFTVKVESRPNEVVDYTRLDVYKGEVTSVEFSEGDIVEVGEGYLFFGASVNGSTVSASVSFLNFVLVLRTGDCGDISSPPDEAASQSTILINDLKTEGLGKGLGKKKLVRWYVCDNVEESRYTIDKSIFPDDRYQDYDIVVVRDQTFKFVYDPSMEKTARTIKIREWGESQTQSKRFQLVTADKSFVVRHPGITIDFANVVDKAQDVYVPNLGADSSQAATAAYSQGLSSVSDKLATNIGVCGCETTNEGVRSCVFTPDDIACKSYLDKSYYRVETSGEYNYVASWLYPLPDSAPDIMVHQFFPASGKRATPIRIRPEGSWRNNAPVEPFLVPYNDPRFKNEVVPLIVEDYQDLTLEVNDSMIQHVTYFNVGKVTLDLGAAKTYNEISVTEPGLWSSYLSSVHGITVNSLKVTSDATVQAENATAKKLVTDKASCQLNGITISDEWELTDSFVTLSSATVNSALKVKRTSRFPQIIVTGGNSDFSPKSIEYDMGFTSAAKLLDWVTQTTTLVSGITADQCKALKDKVVLTNAPYFRTVCSDDGSLQVTRTIEDGLNQDLGGAPPPVEVNENPTWGSVMDVPESVKVTGDVTLALADNSNFQITHLEVTAGSQVTAKNMQVRSELILSGGASLKPADDTTVTITHQQTNITIQVQGGQAPTLDLGKVGDYNAVPSVIDVRVNENVKATTIAKGRTLNCEDWLKVVKTSGSKASGAKYRCEMTSSQSTLLSDVLQEWAMIMEADGGGGLSPGAIAGIVIGVLLLVGVVVFLVVFFVVFKGKLPHINKRKGSQRIDDDSKPPEP